MNAQPRFTGPRPPIAPYITAALPTRQDLVPLFFPVLGSTNWRNGYNENRGTHRHTGIDISAPKLRPIVAPFAGVLGFKTQTFWIYADNGYKCLGTHLNDDTPGGNDNRADPDFMFAPNLRGGERVAAGQFIGYVGNSGDATGPHLHFELFAPDSLINPFPSLKRAQRLAVPRLPVGLSLGELPRADEVQAFGCVRGWNAGTRTLSILLVTRRTPNGKTEVITAPTLVSLLVPPAVVSQAGQADALASVPRDRVLNLYLTRKPGSDVRVARKIVLPVSG